MNMGPAKKVYWTIMEATGKAALWNFTPTLIVFFALTKILRSPGSPVPQKF
jgi:hypothetical protein